ncbi:MAG: hypothetical protein HC767_10890 [Akkermansiaceae bacterium]|nr:hypothetical protein [Akkermansiaceae bacterium]
MLVSGIRLAGCMQLTQEERARVMHECQQAVQVQPGSQQKRGQLKDVQGNLKQVIPTSTESHDFCMLLRVGF